MNSQKLNSNIVDSLDSAAMDVFGTSLNDMGGAFKHKNQNHAHNRYIMTFAMVQVCKMDKDIAMLLMNVSLSNINQKLRNFDMMYLDHNFRFKAETFVDHFKKLFTMWYEKMSKEDRERAKEIGLIKEEENKPKSSKYKLVFLYCGSQEIICGPANYKFCKFKYNQVKREPHYQRGELKIINA